MGECDHLTEWCHDGDTYWVCTTCQPNEPPARCQARHDQAVAAAKAMFPENC